MPVFVLTKFDHAEDRGEILAVYCKPERANQGLIEHFLRLSHHKFHAEVHKLFALTKCLFLHGGSRLEVIERNFDSAADKPQFVPLEGMELSNFMKQRIYFMQKRK